MDRALVDRSSAFGQRWSLAALAAGVLLVVASTGDALAQRRLTFGYDQPKTTGYGIAAQVFEDKLKELSGGKLLVDQYPGAQLGQEPVMLQKLRGGDIDFIISSAANASTVQPEAGVMSLHFLFRDAEHLRKALADPRMAEAFQTMLSSVQGARVLGFQTLGLRSMYSKREFKKVEDLKGVKVRVQATKTEDTHFAAYGAQTVHMPFGEVYTSLQTGVVEAAENGINVYMANKHYEVAPVLSITEHEANNGFIWASEKAWNSFSADEKKWVQAAADEVAKVQPDRSLKLDADSANRLEKLGVKVVRDVDKSGFIKIAAPVQDDMAKELGPNAVKVLELVRSIK
jgi:tripartite ATP-independent transporter DctP family solute receptor